MSLQCPADTSSTCCWVALAQTKYSYCVYLYVKWSTRINSSSFMCCQIPETLRGFRSILQMSFTKRNSASQLQDDVMRRCERQGTPGRPLGSEWRINGRPGRRRLLLHFRCTSKVSLHLAVSRPKMPCMSSWIQILGARTLSLHCFAVSTVSTHPLTMPYILGFGEFVAWAW